MAVGNKFAESQGFSYVPNDAYLQKSFKGSTPLDFSNISSSGIISQAPIPLKYIQEGSGGDDGPYIIPKDDDDDETYTGSSMSVKNAAKEVGKMFLMGGPQAYIMQKLISKGIGAFKDYRNKNKVEKYTGQEMSSYRDDRPSSEKNYTGGDTNPNPSTPGAQDSFSNKSGMGRTGYFFGGRVNYKAGGRTGYKEGYSVQDDMGDYAENVGKEAAPGGGFVGDDGGNDEPTFYSPPDKKTITTDFISKNPNLTIDYTDPRNFASLKGKVGFGKFLDNDDITAEGNVTGEFGPISYDASLTEKGLTGVDLTAGNFNANIDANKNLKNIQYNRGPLSVGYSGDGNYFAKLGINYKNGGLASIL